MANRSAAAHKPATPNGASPRRELRSHRLDPEEFALSHLGGGLHAIADDGISQIFRDSWRREHGADLHPIGTPVII